VPRPRAVLVISALVHPRHCGDRGAPAEDDSRLLRVP
jgi:hypothetical protein